MNMAQPPAWLELLVDAVAQCMEAHSVLGPLGYRWGEEDGFWEVMVFPSAAEMVGGAEDGAMVAPCFSLDLRELSAAFEEVIDVYWRSHALGPHDQAGAHVAIEGRYKGRHVFLQVLREAPPDERPGFRVDGHDSKGLMPETGGD